MTRTVVSKLHAWRGLRVLRLVAAVLAGYCVAAGLWHLVLVFATVIAVVSVSVHRLNQALDVQAAMQVRAETLYADDLR